MCLPNFLIIGAAKSATTSLHEYLAQHPQIFMSRIKEPNFFAFAGKMPSYIGPDDVFPDRFRYNRRFRQEKYLNSIIDLREYKKLFRSAKNEIAIGESSVISMYIPATADRIKNYIPDIRLLAILRNPADRAFSKYSQFVRDNCEPEKTFVAALKAEDNRIKENWAPSWHYKRRGFYYAQLKNFYNVFGREQIRVYLFEDLITCPLGMLRDVFQFLGVDERFRPDIDKKFNVSGEQVPIPRNAMLDYLINERNFLKTIVKNITTQNLRDRLKSHLVYTDSVEPDLRKQIHFPGELRRKLLEEYRPDIEQLQDLINRDLSVWLAKT